MAKMYVFETQPEFHGSRQPQPIQINQTPLLQAIKQTENI